MSTEYSAIVRERLQDYIRDIRSAFEIVPRFPYNEGDDEDAFTQRGLRRLSMILATSPCPSHGDEYGVDGSVSANEWTAGCAVEACSWSVTASRDKITFYFGDVQVRTPPR